MTARIDLTGHTYGRLKVLHESSDRLWGRVTWACVCECGSAILAITSSLRGGNTRSCGCLQKDAIRAHGKPPTTHGMSNTPTYKSWKSMMDRCYLKTHESFPSYGGVGVRVVRRWHTFAGFFADMGIRPKGKTLDRIRNDAGYGPRNCRWATRREQANNRRCNVILTYKGKSGTIAQWARGVGLNPDTLGQRIKRGWSVERALTTP